MKKGFILWSSSLVVIFLISYFKIISSDNYPLSGTISINGEKLTYKLDKEGFGSSHKIMLRTDLDNLDVKALILRNNLADTLNFRKSNGFYECTLERKITGQSFNYNVVINKNNFQKTLPSKGVVSFYFWGKIHSMLSGIYWLFLLTGLVLVTRSGFDYFNENIKAKKIILLSDVVLLTFIFFINPLYLSYKFEYINHTITPIETLFPLSYLIIFIILIVTTLLSFKKSFQQKPVSLIGAILVLIVYLLS
jgi:hypothetical protein